LPSNVSSVTTSSTSTAFIRVRKPVSAMMGLEPLYNESSVAPGHLRAEHIQLSKGKYHKLGKHVLKDNNVLILSFNKYGILNNKQFLTKKDINSIEFVKKETVNEISQQSFVTKFLQSVREKMYNNRK